MPKKTAAAVTAGDPGEFIPALRLDLLDASPTNPRVFAGPDAKNPALVELAASIAAQGVLEPVLVRPKGDRYEILAGERRVRSARLAGLDAVPAIVRDLDDRQALEVTVTENLHREDLLPVEEARGVAALLDAGWPADSVAAELGKSRGWVQRRARIARLAPPLLAALTGGDLAHWPAALLEEVARLPVEAQLALWEDDLSCLHYAHPPRLDRLRDEIAGKTHLIHRAGWDAGDETLVPEAGSCAACPKRTGAQPDLFDGAADEFGGSAGGRRRASAGRGATDRCLDLACWQRKADAATQRLAAAVRADLSREPHLVIDADRESWSERQEIRKRYPSAVEAATTRYGAGWRFCAKGAPGAEPAVLVSSSGAGQRVWIQQTVAGGKPKARAAEDSPAAKSAPLRRKEQEARLDARRRVWAIRRVRDLLQASSAPAKKDPPDLVQLVRVFGAGPATPDGRMPPNAWKAYDRPPAGSSGLWPCVRPQLAAELQSALNRPGEAAAKHGWPYVERLAPWLGTTVGELMAAARKEIPDPKGWADNNDKTMAKQPAGTATPRRRGRPPKNGSGRRKKEGRS